MGYFNRDRNNRSGRDNRGSRRSSFGRGGGDREMFKAVCSNCGKDCEVPFKPTTGKPVYCSDCFETMGGRSDRSDKQSLPFQGRPDRSERRDKQSLPFQGRPSFDRHQAPAPRVDNSKQFEDLNRKMDKIIELLTPKAKTPKVKKEKVVKEVK